MYVYYNCKINIKISKIVSLSFSSVIIKPYFNGIIFRKINFPAYIIGRRKQIEIMLLHTEKLLRIAYYYTKGIQIAKDIAQEIFIKSYENINNYSECGEGFFYNQLTEQIGFAKYDGPFKVSLGFVGPILIEGLN